MSAKVRQPFGIYFYQREREREAVFFNFKFVFVVVSMLLLFFSFCFFLPLHYYKTNCFRAVTFQHNHL